MELFQREQGGHHPLVQNYIDLQKTILIDDLVCEKFGVCKNQQSNQTPYDIHHVADDDESQTTFQVKDDLIKEQANEWTRNYNGDFESCDGYGNCAFDLGDVKLELDKHGNVRLDYKNGEKLHITE